MEERQDRKGKKRERKARALIHLKQLRCPSRVSYRVPRLLARESKELGFSLLAPLLGLSPSCPRIWWPVIKFLTFFSPTLSWQRFSRLPTFRSELTVAGRGSPIRCGLEVSRRYAHRRRKLWNVQAISTPLQFLLEFCGDPF